MHHTTYLKYNNIYNPSQTNMLFSFIVASLGISYNQDIPIHFEVGIC